MKTHSDKVLVDAIESVLNPLSFKKHGKTWCRTGHGCIAVVNLQKSRWGRQFYINLAIYIGDCDTECPKENLCDIRVRVERILNESPDRLKEALDLENLALTNDERQLTITNVLEQHGISFLNACSSILGIREAFRKGTLRVSMMNKKAQALVEEALSASN